MIFINELKCIFDAIEIMGNKTTTSNKKKNKLKPKGSPTTKYLQY